MSIHYVVQPRVNLKEPASGPKYHPVSKSLKPLDRDFLIRDMVNHTSLTYQEAASGIDYLFQAIPFGAGTDADAGKNHGSKEQVAGSK